MTNQGKTQKIKSRTKSWLIMSGVALFVLIFVFTSYFSRGALLNRANQVIETKKAAIRELIRSQPALTQGIIRSGEKNQGLSTSAIRALDNQWIKSPEKSKLITRLLVDDLSHELNRFTSTHPSFKEIFITDARGLVVALTNPTSDYYQADEDWWNRTFNEGNYVGPIEYDESAQSLSYGIFYRIYGDKGEIIGILKGVLDADDVRILGEDLQKQEAG